MSLIGVLIGYLTDNLHDTHYYIGIRINVVYLFYYHFTNFVILIPILLKLSLLLFNYIQGYNIEDNVSNR